MKAPGQARVMERPSATLWDYVSIARLDYAIKHIFIVPGLLLALALRKDASALSLIGAGLTLLSCVLAASSNYVINEWLDASFDAFHPGKSARPCVAKNMSGTIVLLEYLTLAGAALLIASAVAHLVLYATIALLVAGLVYNLSPIRSKDVVVLDVLSEAINNPIRMVFGWAMVDPTTLPPGSTLLAYWMGGAFLMNTKRLAEFRDVLTKTSAQNLHRYRRSFRHYTEHRLIVASFFYALIAIGAVMIFIIKYRIEYVLAAPFLAALFAVYLDLGLRPQSTAQAPERLFREPLLMASIATVAAVFVIFTFVDVPFLDQFVSAHYIRIR